MNEVVIAELKNMTVYGLACWIGFIGVLCVGIKQIITMIVNAINTVNERKAEYKAYKDIVDSHVVAIQALQDADADISASIQDVSATMTQIASSIEDMRDKDKTNKLNDLRHALLNYYEKYCLNNPSKTIDNMNMKNYHDTLDIYVNHYHGNTYVLDVIVPAMKELHVVKVWDEENEKPVEIQLGGDNDDLAKDAKGIHN